MKATALALPLSLAAVAADAASGADTVRQNQQLSTFAKAIEAARFGQQLSGQGPYTVFAPTDRTAPEDAALPATEHQQQVLAGGEQGGAQLEAQGQQQVQQTAETPVAQGSDMPMTEHQQEVLANEPGQEQQQTRPRARARCRPPSTSARCWPRWSCRANSSSPRAGAGPGRPDILREAMVVAGIQADNGVIHVIDAVLVPQEMPKMLESAKQGQG